MQGLHHLHKPSGVEDGDVRGILHKSALGHLDTGVLRQESTYTPKTAFRCQGKDLSLYRGSEVRKPSLTIIVNGPMKANIAVINTKWAGMQTKTRLF